MSKLLIFFFLLGCTKFYEVEKKNGIYLVRQVYSEIDSAKDVDWKIGRKREETISKGMRFSFTLPKIDDHGKTLLKKKYGIDSWVYRISREHRGQTRILGFFYYPLSSMTGSTKNYTLNLYYHAAAVSKRFRLFHCPAFNHRAVIGKIKIADRPLASAKDMFVREYSRIPAKVSRIHINPMIFSAGVSMVGTYYVDFAFYDSETKKRYSEWNKVDNTIVITQETSKNVSSCVGIKEEVNPLPESRMPNIRDLEIR